MSSQSSLGLYKSEIPLRKFATQVQEAKNVYDKKVQENRRIHFLALGLIAIMAASAATLITLSGGPGLNALYFYTGVAFGAVSINFMVFLAVIVVRKNRMNKDLKKEASGTKDFIENQQIYDVMLERFGCIYVKKEEVQAVVNTFSEEGLENFARIAVDSCPASGLGSQESIILSCIAHSTTFKSLSPESQIGVLELLPQEEATAAVAKIDVHADFSKLVEKAVDGKYPKTYAAIAEHRELYLLDVNWQRTILEKLTLDQAAAYILSLEENKYVSLVKNALDFYSSNPNHPTVVQAFALSNKSVRMESEYQRLLIEKAEDQGKADLIVSRLNLDQYNALVNMFHEKGNQISTNALASSGHTAKLSPEVQACLISNVDQKRASTIVNRLELEPDCSTKYKEIVTIAFDFFRKKDLLDTEFFNALASSAYTPELPSEHARWLIENADQEFANGIIGKLNVNAYKALVAEIAEETIAIGAIASSPSLSQLSVDLLLRLIGHANLETASRIVDRLDFEKYHALVKEVKVHPEKANAHNFIAFASSSHAQALSPDEKQLIGSPFNLRELIEKEDLEAAKETVSNLLGERFEALAIDVRNNPNLVVIEALYQQANLLTPEQHFAFIGALSRDAANKAIDCLNLDNYHIFAKYAFGQPYQATVHAALVHRPSDFAEFVAKERISQEAIKETVALMNGNELQSADFLRRLTDRSECESSRELIKNIVWDFVQKHIYPNSDFSKSFGSELATGRQALFEQFCRWPGLIGEQIVNKNMWEHALLTAFWEQMDTNEKSICTQAMASLMMNYKDTERASTYFKFIIDGYGNSIPAIVVGALAKTPKLFVPVITKLSAAQYPLEHIVEHFADAGPLGGYIDALHANKGAYKKLVCAVFKKAVSLKSDAERTQFIDQVIVNVLKPLLSGDFRDLLVDNNEISEDPHVRYELAFEVLEQMSLAEAKEYIANLDSYTFIKGHTHYEAMIRALVNQAADSDVNALSEERKQLMILFNKAPQRDKVNGNLNKLNWDNFNQIVEGNKENRQ